MTFDETSPDITVVVPVYNEEDNVTVMAEELAAALNGRKFEVIYVNDGSTDATMERLKELQRERPWLRILVHEKNAGQSRAVRNAVTAARAPVVVTIDGDLQNDPADIPAMVDRLTGADGAGGPFGLVAGRRRKRQDTAWKRFGSRVGNGVRKRLLRDGCDDTACGLKAFKREASLALPFFDNMHRFLPALMLRDGWPVDFMDVHHRPRLYGVSKYTNFGRLAVSMTDLFGVMWLQSRRNRTGAVEEV